MRLFLKKHTIRLLGLAVAFLALQSCNKEFEDIAALNSSTPQGQTAGALIESDASFSILKAAVTKAGLMNTLKNSGSSFTVFAPDDAAFAASGLTIAHINGMSAAQLNAVLSYHIIPQALPSAQIPITFPNVQMPTLLPLPINNPLVKMSIFPSKRGTALWANNIPIKQADVAISNGVLHKVAAIVMPPLGGTLKTVIGADADLSYFRAAVARADEGQTGLNRLDSVLNFGVANLTVFAPGNDAFKALLTAMLPAGTPISEAVFAFLPVETVRGIVAYHMLGIRAYSVNMPTTPTFIPTLLNGAVPTHPGVNVQATFTGPVVSELKVTGVGNGGMSATVTSKDNNAVNGVLHKINMVLLPQ